PSSISSPAATAWPRPCCRPSARSTPPSICRCRLQPTSTTEAEMQSNGLLKWLLIPFVLLLVFVGVKLFSGGDGQPPGRDAGVRLTPEEAQLLGVEGDTPRDTVATLVAQVRQLRTELQSALTENKAQRDENERLRQREGAIDRRIQS